MAAATEVTVDCVGDDGCSHGERFLMVHEKTEKIELISYLKRRKCYAEIRDSKRAQESFLFSQKEFYFYLLVTWDRIYDASHYAGKLLQQFIIDL